MKTIYSALIRMAVLCGLFYGNAAYADDEPEYVPLNKSQYEKLLSGHVIKGEYRFMRERTKTFRFSELHRADGTTDYKEGKLRIKGIWYTVGERKVCYKYPGSVVMGGSISCFWVYKSEDCYYGYNIGQMSLNGPRNYNDWAARWVLEGSGGSCAAPVS
ncbi:MAG: hypothetical protein COA69_12490 [Robiginitomaculum sp.]|nr:MAG: hypothetical protein COA69_12490 [Robiginitomaculum sp.]